MPENILDKFGSRVFTTDVMRRRLPKQVFQSLIKTNKEGKKLDPDVADHVASVMKDWALENGATHYSHWFQPMNNATAGKHNSFLTVDDNAMALVEFSGRALVQGEPDASSFPNGGLRATFEARGYTAWDPTSPAFIRDHTLFIPTAFCTYHGEALDKKTPLLRSMQAVSRESLRVLRLFGNHTAKRVIPTVGAEQEYFIIDRELYEQRLDLKLCGRTLFGARPPKGQELDDHYCGRIRIRVGEFMKALDDELWNLGCVSITKHNEVAPCQHELALLHESANIATDNNQLAMETMRMVAKKLGLACLLHEKPFAGVNGSGKHNNWSLCTDDGVNLFDPGETPYENMQFLVFLCAVICAIDRYADLIRLSAANVGNEYRLGGGEAPPSIISVYLGDELTTTLVGIANGYDYEGGNISGFLKTGVATLPRVPIDSSDRNRTSPFAFTGNRFEFRMVGSSDSIADANVYLNTAVAELLSEFAGRLEACPEFDAEIKNIITDTVVKHGRIIFNGDGYSSQWGEEAAKRGLINLKSCVDAFPAMITEKNMALFSRFKVLTENECRSRHEILLENYVKVVSIEAKTMLEMASRQVIPACIAYLKDISVTVAEMQHAGVSSHTLTRLLGRLSATLDNIDTAREVLSHMMDLVSGTMEEKTQICHAQVTPAMASLRAAVDEAEMMVSKEYWKMPTYTDLLYRV